jgi:hypothetical protein
MIAIIIKNEKMNYGNLPEAIYRYFIFANHHTPEVLFNKLS